MNKTIFATALFLFGTIVTGQEAYTLKMTVKTEGLPAEYAAYGEQEITTYMKGDKTKTDVSSMMFNSTVYFDGKMMTSLSETMGNKTGFTATKEELETNDKGEKKEKPVIEYTNEKKMIAGYECTKAVVTTVGKDKKENKTIVWTTDKIKGNPSARRGGGRGGMVDLSDVKGHPLAMEMTQMNQGQEMKIIMTTTEVATTPLDDKIFIPNTEGYKMMTYKEMLEKQKTMGGR